MDVQTLIRAATDEELPVIAAAARRLQERPCVLVTVREGSKTRRYVVAQEDEEMIRPLVGMDRSEWEHEHAWFGAQWLRGFGRVDEMYRSLGLYDIVKVEEAPRAKVWGER